MEKHVVSLEIAKKLKEMRWEKETNYSFTNLYRVDGKFDLVNITKKQCRGKLVYAAPLATEILEELPKWWKHDRGQMLEIIYSDGDVYWVNYTDYTGSCPPNVPEIEDKSLPDALARMWLYLKENNLLKVEAEKE